MIQNGSPLIESCSNALHKTNSFSDLNCGGIRRHTKPNTKRTRRKTSWTASTSLTFLFLCYCLTLILGCNEFVLLSQAFVIQPKTNLKVKHALTRNIHCRQKYTTAQTNPKAVNNSIRCRRSKSNAHNMINQDITRNYGSMSRDEGYHGIKSTTFYPRTSPFHKTEKVKYSFRRKSLTALKMVFTTSSSLVEKISTRVLLDDLIDESTRTAARNPVMMQFDPSSGWIWRRWKGTVFSETWRTFFTNICYASTVWIFFRFNKTQFLQNLKGFNILWGQLLSVTTFTLTFFLNQSYSLWRGCYDYSRRLQGRLNDLNMTLAAHASRKEPTKKEEINGNGNEGSFPNVSSFPNGSSSPSEPSAFMNGEAFVGIAQNGNEFSTYTEPARQVLELMARYTRVFNLLTYASFTGSHRPLLTPQGMRRLVDRGIITENERKILSDAQLPVTQRHNVLLLWIIRLFLDSRKAGHIEGNDGFEQQFLEKCHVIRAQYGAIGDELAGRMPLAYAHIVQVLVDVILWMYPFMAFSQGMTPFLGVLGTGLLTMFYQGLFDLAKQFLDPYDNESYGKGEDPLCIDTLIAETNAGSIRWMNGLAEKPFLQRKIDAGNMLDYQLPVRGWTVVETDEIEERARVEQAQMEVNSAIEEETRNDIEKLIVMDEGAEEIMMLEENEVSDDECSLPEEENLTMEEALEKMSECTEKVP